MGRRGWNQGGGAQEEARGALEVEMRDEVASERGEERGDLLSLVRCVCVWRRHGNERGRSMERVGA